MLSGSAAGIGAQSVDGTDIVNGSSGGWMRLRGWR